jgi:microcystin-dependent protein
MSKIAVSPNGSGTGTYTLASPNNNASHTITLPVATGELLTSTGNGSGLTSLTSANLTGALPAISGSSLTSLTSANLTGALPAIDGSNLTGLGGGTPAGVVIYHAANTAPTGFIKANGASISTSTYSDLFAVIGYTFGGSGGSFNVPDLRGEFLRGWDDGRGVDSGRGFGSSQGGAMQQHRHTINSGGGGGGIAILVTQTNRVAGLSGGGALQDAPSTLGSVSGGATTATETRPRNIALLACIKY